MLEDREFEGYWWLPLDPEKTVPGTLAFSQKGIRLELLGTFNDEVDPFAMPEDQPRILGTSRDGKAITLEDCLGLGITVKTGFPESAYGPHLVLAGAWYEADEEVRFDEVVVRLSDLDTWAVTSGFTSNLVGEWTAKYGDGE